MKNKILVFGPWVGEFGWELFECQSIIRKFSEKFDSVICSSLPDNKILYQDFCDEFIPFEHDRTFSNGWSNTIDLNVQSILKNDKYLEIFSKYDTDEYYRILPETNVKTYSKESNFIEYGNFNKNLKYDIILHMRNRKGVFAKRNWGEDKWINLVDKLYKKGYKIACVGGFEDYFFENKMDDFRLCGLEKESDLLKSSGLIVGGLSGGVHFGGLCGASRITWGDNSYREILFTTYNPLKKEIEFIPKKSPTVGEVYNLIKNKK